MKNGINALDGKTDQQLYDLTQENLKIGQEHVNRRIEWANASGLECYKKFYVNYTTGLQSILGKGEKKRLDRAKSAEERSGALKAVASITQVMRCDEDWRAIHFNETITTAECSALESAVSVDLLQFKAKLTALKSGLFLGKFTEKFKNSVMSGIIGELLNVFATVYAQAEKCSFETSSAQKCHNIKMFAQEIERLFYQLGVTLQAKN